MWAHLECKAPTESLKRRNLPPDPKSQIHNIPLIMVPVENVDFNGAVISRQLLVVQPHVHNLMQRISLAAGQQSTRHLPSSLSGQQGIRNPLCSLVAPQRAAEKRFSCPNSSCKMTFSRNYDAMRHARSVSCLTKWTLHELIIGVRCT